MISINENRIKEIGKVKYISQRNKYVNRNKIKLLIIK